MLFKSPVYTQASGSIGGITYSHNRFGMYTRARTIPVNPDSTRQQEIRAIFAALAGYWSATLTQVQRNAWNLYGDTVEMINKLGDPIKLSGFNHFIRSNSAIVQAGGVQVDAGPTTMSLPTPDSSMTGAASEATQLISVAFDDTAAWCDEDGAHMTILLSSPKGVGVEFIDGPFRLAGAIDGDAITPPTSPQTIAVPFAVTELQNTQIQGRIARADGRLSTPFRSTFAVGS